MNWTRFIAARYVGARQKARLVSFISGLSISGLVLGVGLLLTVLSVMNGFERELRERILGILPQGAIYHRYGVEDWRQLREQVLEHPGIVDAAPFVELQVMFSYRNSVAPAALYGVDWEAEKRISIIEEFISEQAAESLINRDGEKQGAVLGRLLAEQLGVSVGQPVTVLLPNGNNPRKLPKFKWLTVVGIIDSGTEVDQSLALTNLTTAGELYDFPGRVSGLRIKGTDLFEVPHTLARIARSLDYGYYASDWTRTHGNVYQSIQLSKQLVGLILFLIVAIAAFNVVSTLVMVVVDKRGDIAILKTMGATRSEIMSVFVWQGAVIGGVGVTLGLVLGLVGSHDRQIAHRGRVVAASAATAGDVIRDCPGNSRDTEQLAQPFLTLELPIGLDLSELGPAPV